jgi:hypothetical protein
MYPLQTNDLVRKIESQNDDFFCLTTNKSHFNYLTLCLSKFFSFK